MSSADILILSNGPGELTTWVRPVVKALRHQLRDNRDCVRISVVLSPCSHASGKEVAIAQSYSEVDRVQGAEDFFPFLLWGRTAENWDWREQGVVLFLGGDQFFTVVIGKRLSYRTVTYAEWDARWLSWVDRFGVMKPEIIAKIPQKYAHKFTVVGDLMAEAQGGGEDGGGEGDRGGEGDGEDGGDGEGEGGEGDGEDGGDGEGEGGEGDGGESFNSKSKIHRRASGFPQGNPKSSSAAARQRSGSERASAIQNPKSNIELIGLLPGSKPVKLAQGVPLGLAILEQIHKKCPQTRFVIPVAPTLDLATLARFADPQQNPVMQLVEGTSAELVIPEPPALPFLKTAGGVQVELWTQAPAYDLLSQCSLCLTTVGANTAELCALTVPMIVLLPTQQMDAMRSWDGLPGLVANLPILGSSFAKVINWLIWQQGKLYAWPNIWAKAEIVPELKGQLKPSVVADLVLDFLNHPQKLEEMRDRLRSVRGQPGASQKLAQLISEELNF